MTEHFKRGTRGNPIVGDTRPNTLLGWILNDSDAILRKCNLSLNQSYQTGLVRYSTYTLIFPLRMHLFGKKIVEIPLRMFLLTGLLLHLF